MVTLLTKIINVLYLSSWEKKRSKLDAQHLACRPDPHGAQGRVGPPPRCAGLGRNGKDPGARGPIRPVHQPHATRLSGLRGRKVEYRWSEPREREPEVCVEMREPRCLTIYVEIGHQIFPFNNSF